MITLKTRLASLTAATLVVAMMVFPVAGQAAQVVAGA
jgi:hypothetical protein